MMIDFSENGFNMLFNVSDDGYVTLENFSPRDRKDTREKRPKWCGIAEVHLCGENPDDHHFAKHTGGSGSVSLKYKSHEYYKNKDGNKLEITLADEKMLLTVHYQFYTGIPVVRAWTVAQNISSLPIGLEYLSSFSYTGLDDGLENVAEEISVMIPHSAWYKEANWKEYTLRELGYEACFRFSGKRISVSNTGTWSSKEHIPMGAVINRERKSTILWQIENNGSWNWEISDIDGMLYLKLSGPSEQENGWYKELLPGESFESVKVALSLGEDFDSALQGMTMYRRRITSRSSADSTLPVIFNDYMNCLMGDPTEEKLIPIIDKAAEVGAEYYCIDAGWYADGSWWETVGEWEPCSWRFPRGVKFICDYIREKGMIPGIWLEIEAMGIKCPLANKLPDDFFFMRHGRRVIDHGRYQLDFRNPLVRERATRVVDRLVSEWGVGYIKNDYNIEMGVGTEIGSDSPGDGLLSHCRAYLCWIREIREKYPSLVWENCASGGMRMDYAMLSLADIQSASDQTEYRYNANIAAAIASAVLPEQAAIWSYPRAWDSKSAFHMNMVNSLLLRIHLSGEIYGWSDEQMATVKEAVSVYKSIRDDIKESVPFYPLGIPQYGAPFLVSAYRCRECIRMAVWRMDTEKGSIDIPLESDKKSVRVIYPSDNGRAETVNGGVRVTLDEPFSAMVIEIK